MAKRSWQAFSTIPPQFGYMLANMGDALTVRQLSPALVGLSGPGLDEALLGAIQD